MKRLGILLMMAFTLGLFASAQPQSPGRMNPENMAKRETATLKEKLNLSTDQEKKVYNIHLESAKKIAEVRQSMGKNADRSVIHEKMTEIREEQKQAMKKVLTSEQFAAYNKYLEERHSQRGRQGGKPGGRGGR